METPDELIMYNTAIRTRYREQKTEFRWGKPYKSPQSFSEMLKKAMNEKYDLIRITSVGSYYLAKIPENSYTLIKNELEQCVIDKKHTGSRTYLLKWTTKQPKKILKLKNQINITINIMQVE